ncbi:uncharacterized protein [Penaeus vannamei]|uniref:uncharacterized protein n=1 Tax=Penaeus vannamei TaxID=6689 RepID=UPI00387FAE37
MVDDELLRPKHHFVSFVKLCVDFGFFEFASEEYQQISGFAIGSPLNGVIVIVPRRSCLHHTLTRLNSVQGKSQFTVEEEVDQKLPFLGTLIHRGDDGLRFSLYIKQINKEDYIHYSAHSNKTKSGVVIGFFLWSLRICSPEFLESIRLAILWQYSENLQHIRVQDTRHDTRQKQPEDNPNSAVYRIPCSGCDKAYFGETGRGFNTRINEHRADVRHHRASNAMAVHVDEPGHLPNWKEAEIIHGGTNKNRKSWKLHTSRRRIVVLVTLMTSFMALKALGINLCN